VLIIVIFLEPGSVLGTALANPSGDSGNGLTILVLSQGQAELDQCMVFSLSRSDSVQVRFDWGIAGVVPMHHYIVGPHKRPTSCTYA
jgi:hypothetical protein